jgi:hypothetical protein
MPALNFKKHFPPKILAGEKPFTLRALRKDGRDPKIGEPLYMFTGQRQKDCKKFNEAPCRFATTVKLSWRSISIPTLGTITQDNQLQTFSKLDGFRNYDEFCAFHEVTIWSGIRAMRLVAWITRDELKQRIGMEEVKP